MAAAWILIGLSVLALSVYIVGVVCTARHLGQPPAPEPAAFPPVSLLKPVKGLEEGFELNLESVFQQDYPGAFEILISSTEEDDPALRVARRVAARFPQVPCTILVSDASFGLNPKVANLAGAAKHAKHELLWQSDANVRVGPQYLRELVSEMLDRDASMITSVVIGTQERSLGAALENLQLTTYIAPAMCVALRVANITCVCGKSMLLRRSVLERLGGLESVRDVLCEDFVLGRRFEKAGETVVLSRTTVENINVDCGVEQFASRHSRWLKMRATLHVPGFIADLLGNPVGLAVIATLVSGLDRQVVLAALIVSALKLVAEASAIDLMRRPMLLRHALLAPLKDIALVPLWVYASFSRTVVWRGVRLRFGADTQLEPVTDRMVLGFSGKNDTTASVTPTTADDSEVRALVG